MAETRQSFEYCLRTEVVPHSISIRKLNGATGHNCQQGLTGAQWRERMGVGINQIAVNLLLPSSLNQMGPIQYIRVLVSAHGTKVFIVDTEKANLRQTLNLVINHVTSSNSKTNKGKSWQKFFPGGNLTRAAHAVP